MFLRILVYDGTGDFTRSDDQWLSLLHHVLTTRVTGVTMPRPQAWYSYLLKLFYLF